MGISLHNIGKKIGDVLGGVERQINPFDNGATYSNPNPAPQQPQTAQTPAPGVNMPQSGPVPVHPNMPAPGSFFDNLNPQLAPTPVTTAQNSKPKHSAIPLINSPVNTGPLNPGPLTIGKVALKPAPMVQNGYDSTVSPIQAVRGLAQGVARGLYEIPTSLAQAAEGHPIVTKPSTASNFLFGDKPFQTIQQMGASTEKSHPKGFQVGPVHLTPKETGVAETGLQLAQDVPLVSGIAAKAAKVLTPVNDATKVALLKQAASQPKVAFKGAEAADAAKPSVKLAEPAPVVAAPPSPAGSVGADVKGVSAPVKELANKVTVLNHIGTPSSQELAQRITNIDNTTQDLRANYRNAVPTALSLSDKEFRNFGRAVENGTRPINATVKQAVAEHQALFPQIHGNYAATGADVGKIPNYFPRDYSGMKPGTDGYNQALQGLVDSGKAKTTGDAVKLLDILKKRGESAPSFFGSFDKSRLGSDYAVYTKNAYEKYLNGAARKTAEAQQLGPTGQVGNQLIGQISQEGGDHILAQQVLKNYLHDAGAGKGKALSTVRGIFGVARLGKASISHLGQTTNVGLVTRLSDLGAGWAKRFGKEGQQFIKESDVNNPENLHGLVDQATTVHGVMSKGTAPLLSKMMAVNRGVAAIAGRRYGNYLAAQGGEAELRSLGVTGDIGKSLTRDQEFQVARGVTNKTMFTPSRAATPLHAETPLGKTVGQYRLAYSYKQMGLLYDQVIKEAAKGNLAPLVKFTALSSPVAGGTVAIKNKISGRKEGAGGIAADTLGTLGGIPGELAVQAARYGTKYPVSTAASAVAPLAGEAVSIAQDAKLAAEGKPKSAERYVVKLVPVVGSRLAKQLIPTSPGSQVYAQSASDAEKSLKGDTKAASAFKDYLSRSKDPTNGKTIQNSPAESIQNANSLANNDKLRNTVQKFEKAQVDDKGKPSYAPSWNLSPDQLKIYEQYKEQFTGDAAKNVMFSQNPWIKDVEAKDQAFYASLPPGKGSEKNPQTPDYPKFDAFTQQLLDTYDNGSPQDRAALLQNYGPQLSDAWQQKSDWTNAMRRAEGTLELKGYPQADDETKAILKTYNALPQHDGSKGGNATRFAWGQAHPAEYAKMQDYLSQAAMSSLVRNASLDQFKGTEADQALLKDIKNVGTYDIAKTKNADGTSTYALDPSAAAAASAYASSYSNSGYNSPNKQAARNARTMAYHSGIPKIGTKIKRPSVKLSKSSTSVKFKGTPKLAKSSKVALKPSKV